jgi:SRSO17 transposase
VNELENQQAGMLAARGMAARESEPTDYWLSTLPTETTLRVLVRLAKIHWRIEHDYRELTDGLGLDHFEGRSWVGWHRHVTLASVAQAICTKLRRSQSPCVVLTRPLRCFGHSRSCWWPKGCPVLIFGVGRWWTSAHHQA